MTVEQMEAVMKDIDSAPNGPMQGVRPIMQQQSAFVNGRPVYGPMPQPIPFNGK